jgi:hypothetical protein
MEPERPIEKLLRAFTKKRRDQAGDSMQLRPATRQRLQQEISRRSAAKSGGGFLSNLFFGFRPRLAFALCSIAILVIGGGIFLASFGNKKNHSQLASANSTSPKTPNPEPTAPAFAPPPAAAPVVAYDEQDKRGAISTDKPSGASETPAKEITLPPNALKLVTTAKNGAEPSNSPVGVTVASAPSAIYKTESASADSLSGARDLNKDVANRAPQPMTPPAETAPARIATPTLAQREQEKKSEAQKQPSYAAAPSAAFRESAKFDAFAQLPVASQAYNRMDNPPDGKRAFRSVNVPAPVLTSFRLEQNGRDLRVVDADGSIYTGAVEIARQESAAPAAFGGPPKNKPVAAPSTKTSSQAAAQNYFFSVAGTNRNLNQNVVFSGNLIPLTNILSLRSNAGAFGGALRTGRPAPAMPEPSLLSNSRISGKAVIGNEKEIEVNATPAP